MDFLLLLMDFVMHIDKHLAEIVQNYGTWTYLILFFIIFSETGLVVTPFLPGDSLLFVIGALSASGALDFQLILALLMIAAVAGNLVNYFIGRLIGQKVVKMNSRLLKKEYLDNTHAFYEKHGGKAIILSRFLPILRTFAPFVAGIGKMSFLKFFSYNLIGGIAWVLAFTFGGYLFGNIPVVKNNFTYVTFGIIFVSILPALTTFLKTKKPNALRDRTERT